MLENCEGEKVFEVMFCICEGNEWKDVIINDLFVGKNVVVFVFFGVFMLICLFMYLLCYNELVLVFKVNGIDEIVCLLVNDGFVMNVWVGDQDVSNICFILDGNGEFSEKMGMLVGKQDLGFGLCSWCYFMLVKDGVIEKMFIELEKFGDLFEVFDVDIMFIYINGEVLLFQCVIIFIKLGCLYCVCVKCELCDVGFKFEEIELGNCGLSYSILVVVIGVGIMLQVYIEGQCIGGVDEFSDWLKVSV